MQSEISLQQRETMKKRYEHRPGLFGLASIASGCAAKHAEMPSQGDSISAGKLGQINTKSESEPRKGKTSSQPHESTTGTGNEA